MSILVEAHYVEFKAIEEQIWKLLDEYSADYFTAADLISSVIKVIVELDSKSSQNEKCRRLRDAFKKALDHQMADKVKIIEAEEMKKLGLIDPKVKQDLDRIISQVNES